MDESDRKRTLYVGGLDENVDASVLTAAFIPFGDIKDIQIPKDNETGTHFVTAVSKASRAGDRSGRVFLYISLSPAQTN